MSYVGTYQLVASQNFQEYLQEFGVPLVKRVCIQLGLKVVDLAIVTSSKDGEWTFASYKFCKKNKMKFELGKSYITTNLEGQMIKCIAIRERNHVIFIEKALDQGQKCVRETLKFYPNKVVWLKEVIGGEVTCTLVFKKTETEPNFVLSILNKMKNYFNP